MGSAIPYTARFFDRRNTIRIQALRTDADSDHGALFDQVPREGAVVEGNWSGVRSNCRYRAFETIVDLIDNTRTAAGFRVKAKLDKRKYPTGEAVTKAEMDALSLHRNEFRGDWNYEIRPR